MKVLILCNIRSVHNTGSLFRTAECFGIDHIYLVGVTPAPVDRFLRMRADFAKVALGAEKIVPYTQCESLKEAITHLPRPLTMVIGLEQDDSSMTLQEYSPTNNWALVLGEETKGLTAEEKVLCDVLVEIPQHGKKESLNVSNAGAIALYAFSIRS